MNPQLNWKQLFRDWLNRMIARKWFDVGLQSKMSALVAIGLTGLIAIFAFISISTVRQGTQQLLNEHVFHARILAASLDSKLGKVAGLLSVVSSQIDMNEPDATFKEWGTVFNEDFAWVRGVYLFDGETKLVASTTSAPDMDWKSAPSLRVSPQMPARNISVEGAPRPYVLVVVPVYRLGKPVGALAAVVDLSNPAVFLETSSLGADYDSPIQIVDGNGQVLASFGRDATMQPNVAQLVDRLFVEGRPTAEACLGCSQDEVDETGTIVTFAPLSQADWGVVIWHNSNELFASVRRLGLQILALGAVTLLGAFILVLVTTRSVITPVQALTDATRKISDEQFDIVAIQSVECSLTKSLEGRIVSRDEIGILSNSFIAMCGRLQSSVEEIQSLNRDLDARVQARTQQLSILNAVALTVNQSLDLDDILNRALDEVTRLAGIDMVAIYLQDISQGHLRLMAYRGLSEAAARTAYQVGLLDNSCGGVLELGKAIVVPDISAYRGRGARSLKKEHINALMHVPLMTKGLAMGSMCLGTRSNIEFDDEEQKLLSSIGNQIAIAIENARLYAEVQHKERVRGELFQKALAAQEDERKRIARELHDEISQSLTALLYEAEDGLEMETRPAFKDRFKSIHDLAHQTLDNVHNMMFDLRPSMLDQLGLIPALRTFADMRLGPKGIRVNLEFAPSADPLNVHAEQQRLSPEIEIALYRVVQEAINNIARHSAARNAHIRLELNDGAAIVNVTDDGIGFDAAEFDISILKDKEIGATLSNTARGLGIIGIRERIELLGGEMDIVSAQGHGTQINIRVPLEERSVVHD